MYTLKKLCNGTWQTILCIFAPEGEFGLFCKESIIDFMKSIAPRGELCQLVVTDGKVIDSFPIMDEDDSINSVSTKCNFEQSDEYKRYIMACNYHDMMMDRVAECEELGYIED